MHKKDTERKVGLELVGFTRPLRAVLLKPSRDYSSTQLLVKNIPALPTSVYIPYYDYMAYLFHII